MSGEKRPASNSFSSSQLVKRQKSDANLSNGNALVNGEQRSGALVQSYVQVVLSRREPEADIAPVLWRARSDCNNYGVLRGHKGAVLDLQYSRDPRILFSASADATIAIWDTQTGQRIRRHVGHEDVVNTLEITQRGAEMLVSGSDDGTIGIWDPHQKEAVDFIETDLPITALAMPEAGNEIYVGDVSPDIKVYDVRKKDVMYTLSGHTDLVASLKTSPDSQYLLSNSHDSTVRTWDVRPFAPEDRSVQTYDGAPTYMEKNLYKAVWDSEGKRIAAGSGDRTAVVWDVRTGKLLHKLPGHKGAVNDVRFSPADSSVLLSGSTDRNVMLGELK
ncbi:MAG: hypothetical protein Q9162_005419 [Coniocarpon cinnabarinum]